MFTLTIDYYTIFSNIVQRVNPVFLAVSLLFTRKTAAPKSGGFEIELSSAGLPRSLRADGFQG